MRLNTKHTPSNLVLFLGHRKHIGQPLRSQHFLCLHRLHLFKKCVQTELITL